MKKKLFKRVISSLLALIMTFATGLSYITAEAAIKSVDSTSDVFNEANSLLIQKYPDITGFSYETNISSSRMNVYNKDASTPANSHLAGFYFSNTMVDGSANNNNFRTTNYGSYLDGYAAVGFEVTDGLKSSDYIKTTHNNVGTYDGNAIDMIVTYTNFTQKDSAYYTGSPFSLIEKGYSYLDISANPYNGYVYANIDWMQTIVEYVYSGTSTVVEVTGAYLSFNSLNGPSTNIYDANTREWVNYENADVTSDTDAYVRNDTNVKYENAAQYSAYTSYTGNAFLPQSDDFEDVLGADTYTKNSVSFKLTGTTQTFSVGAVNSAIAWNSFSSAQLWTSEGVAPTKAVDKSFAQAGETLTYSLTQKVHTLGQDLLTKYNTFEFVDKLPDEVEYEDVKFTGEDGTDYTSYGTKSYDASTHTITFTTNDDFRQNVMKYEAESYTLQIITKVKTSIDKTTTIYNTGQVNIDGTNQSTNEVETLVSPFPPGDTIYIEKNIKTNSGNVKEYTLGSYSEDITFEGTIQLPNTTGLTSVVVSDPLDSNLTFKELKVYNSANKEITSHGTTQVSGQEVTFTFNSSHLSTISGDTIRVEIVANYNGKTSFADMPNNKITNTMSLTVNGNKTDSNEVTINAPALKIEKSVDKSEISVGDTATYTINVTNTVAGTTANNVAVTDTSLPAGFEYVSATTSGVDATIAQSGNGFVAKAASLAYGETLTITYRVKATSAANGATTTNTATAVADNADPKEDTTKVYVNTAELAINKKVSKKEWQVGDTVDYTVEVRNTASGTTAKNVEVSDISLPEGLAVDGDIVVSKDGVIVVKEGTGFKATCAELAYNETITITFTCTATEAVNGSTVVNTATVTADNADPKEDTAEVYINSPALSIEKESSKKEWQVGDMVDYTVNVKNTKKDTVAKNVVISDISLPVGLAVTGDVTVKGIESFEVEKTSTGFIITVAELPYGTTIGITYECEAKEVVNGSEVENTATAVADNADNVEDKEKVYINSPELTVEKVSSQSEWQVGDMVDYTIEVKNTENGTVAKNVVVTDISLPEGLAVTGDVTASGVNATVTKEGTGFVINVAELAYGETLTITYVCEAKEAVNGSNVTNKVTVTSDNDDPKEDKEKVYINSPELTVEKVASQTELKVGETFDYAISVANIKKGTVAKNVVVTDTTLPDYIEVSGDDITVSGPESLEYELVKTGNGFVINIAEMQGEEEVVITVPCIVQEGATGKEVINTVSVSSDNTDPKEDKEKVWVNNPALEITKAADNIEKTYDVGDTVTYLLTLENNAVGTVATNVTANDTIETEGVELQPDTIVLKDAEGNEITPKGLTVDGNSFAMETGVNLVNENNYILYDGEEIEQDNQNPLEENNYTKLFIEYQVKIVSSSLAGKEVYNLAVVNSDEDIPDEDDETIQVVKDNGTITTSTSSKIADWVKTGDNSKVLLLMLFAVISGTAIIITLYKKKKGSEKNENEEEIQN